MSELMAGKKGLIMGVANEKSMAWKIAQKLDEEGAELAFTYKDEATGERVVPLFEGIGADFYEILDVTDDADFAEVFEKLTEEFDGELDFIVHSIAGGPKREDLKGKYMNTARESFTKSFEISVYSYVKAVQMAYPMLKESDSAAAITLSYYGAEKVVPNYNVMGVAKAALESSVRYLADDLGSDNIRINALSPGPVLTRAASGIGDFRKLLKDFKAKAPLERLIDKDEVASSALYLLSDLSSGVTGEIMHVDCGFNIEA